jgi:hypothetical protein
LIEELGPVGWLVVESSGNSRFNVVNGRIRCRHCLLLLDANAAAMELEEEGV